jgi:phospholipid transport system substrate-binding protein
LAVVVAGTAVAQSAASDGSQRYGSQPGTQILDGSELIRSLADQVLPVIANKGMSQAQRAERMRAIYRAHFDHQAIGAAVMGRVWQEASPEQRTHFLQALESYVAYSYAAQLSDYAGERLVVQGSTADGDGVVVMSQIARAQGPANVTWRLRKAGNGFKIRDVAIENVSMTLTLRRELAAAAQSRGGGAEAMVAAMQGMGAGQGRK